MSKADVAVVGGGIIGAFSSYYLAKDGFEVSWLVGRNPREAASWGNAGFLAVGTATPLPEFESLGRVVRWTLQKGSPLKVGLKFILKQGGWLALYMKEGRRSTEARAVRLLRQMGLESLEAIEEMVMTGLLSPEFSRKGALAVYLKSKNLEKHVEGLKTTAEVGHKFQVLTADECRRLEPLLSGEVSGGILFEEDGWVHPAKILLQMRRLAEQVGAKVFELEATGLGLQSDAVNAIDVHGEKLTAENYVFALGAHTRMFFKRIGLDIPVAPAWGHTVTLEPITGKLSRPVMIGESKVALSQTHDGNMRVSGFFELSTPDFRPPESRYAWLTKRAGEVIPRLRDLKIVDSWSGMRPCTPDGLPIIGRLSRLRNVILAVGHCREGLTMAPATGRMVMGIIRSGSKSVHPMLSPERFKL